VNRWASDGSQPAEGRIRRAMALRLAPVPDHTPVPNPARDETIRPTRRRSGFVRRAIWVSVVVLAVVVLVGAGRLPFRRYLENTEAIAETQEQLDAVRESNGRLQEQVDRLATDEELERVAREQYGYAKPGEEVYHVQQPAEDPVAIPEVWPFTELHDRLNAVDPTRSTTSTNTAIAGMPSSTSTTSSSPSPSTTVKR